jgi:tRNA modification GTPase
MSPVEPQTIAALATAPQPAGLAVVRASGPKASLALRAIFRSKNSPVDTPRTLIFGEIIDYKTKVAIDHAMAVFMPGPKSYTGEDIVEFQFHGSQLLVQKVLRSLYAYGLVPAQAGEFTKRAFLNSKIDLTQAEAVSDLVAASNEQALKIASEQLEGKLSVAINEIAEPLRDLVANMEADIDFPEEGITPDPIEMNLGNIQHTRKAIAKVIESYGFGRVIRDGFKVLLVGPPNAGKSSLLNALIGKQRAIVTPIPGTTRDLIEETITIGERAFVVCDSAGMTQSSDTVEKIGIELAFNKLNWADLVLFLADGTDKHQHWKTVLKDLKGKAKKIWLVVNKIDLNQEAIGRIACEYGICAQTLYISVTSKQGLDLLKEQLVAEVESLAADGNARSAIVTNERHLDCFLRAAKALELAEDALKSKLPVEVTVGELRVALSALDEIIGKTYNEDILGRIFSRFCIGK